MTKKLIAALLTLLCGCSTTATLSRTTGKPIEGRINRSDAQYLYVELEEGEEGAIPRASVNDIDHPGNATAVLGGLLGAYGVLNIAAGAETCGESEGAVGVAFCTGMVLPAAFGAGMLIWGLTTWGRSTSAAENAPVKHTGVVPSPRPTSPFDFPAAGERGQLSSVRAP